MIPVNENLPLVDLTSGIRNVDRATKSNGNQRDTYTTDMALAVILAFTMGFIAALGIFSAVK